MPPHPPQVDYQTLATFLGGLNTGRYHLEITDIAAPQLVPEGGSYFALGYKVFTFWPTQV